MSAIRATIAAARRVVVKVGSSSLTTAEGGIADERITALAGVLAARATRGAELVLVSSGAIAAGLAPLGLGQRPRDLATQQAAASVGQVLPVVNENDTVATEEIRFGDNDRLAALVAHVIRADALVLLSDVDALYDGDPHRSGSERISEIRSRDDLAGLWLGRPRGRGVGTGGMVTKVESALIATGAGIPAVLSAASQAGAALAGEPVGTYFAADGRRPATRLLWLAHATTGRGRLLLDPGAVEAVAKRRTSLLPAGVTGVEGQFEAGDPVDLCDEAGAVVARGVVNFDAGEIPGLMGRSTRWLARELGPGYEREIVHRDDLVVFRSRDPRG